VLTEKKYPMNPGSKNTVFRVATRGEADVIFPDGDEYSQPAVDFGSNEIVETVLIQMICVYAATVRTRLS
jgi:hypothetical protein